MSGPKWHPGLHQICRAHTSAIFRNAVFDSQRVLSALPSISPNRHPRFSSVEYFEEIASILASIDQGQSD
ncbi:hypothetical protein QLQ11_01485 [Ochrobactrum sp. SSR]|uniref:hypothetical protein n=1 Tax=Ochrobactrum sp. SSR TaxID=3045176 RepID=UPI0027A00C02|nr:hypothetical protein QLQ11_01485 [Ochrobactrum sp. SSR]